MFFDKEYHFYNGYSTQLNNNSFREYLGKTKYLWYFPSFENQLRYIGNTNYIYDLQLESKDNKMRALQTIYSSIYSNIKKITVDVHKILVNLSGNNFGGVDYIKDDEVLKSIINRMREKKYP